MIFKSYYFGYNNLECFGYNVSVILFWFYFCFIFGFPNFVTLFQLCYFILFQLYNFGYVIYDIFSLYCYILLQYFGYIISLFGYTILVVLFWS